MAWKALGAETSAAEGGSAAVPVKTQPFRVNIGREQWGGGRWGFKGAVDDLRVYGRALSEEEMSGLAAGTAPEGAAHVWPMDEAPGGKAPMQLVDGKVGKAWQLTAYVDGKAANAAGSAGVQPVGARFSLKPGKPVMIALAMDSVFKNRTYAEDVVRAVSHMSHGSHTSHIADLRRAHAAWWADYWAKSSVEIGDPLLEQQYYRSLYSMGALSRDPVFPQFLGGLPEVREWPGREDALCDLRRLDSRGVRQEPEPDPVARVDP